ncbi:hypothetical protein CAL7716_087990 [Calothrix sp. PCC 7716]|nr:hypothetical protein CAL7716_087990 [Calothrix sp. PCC 7716]
MVTRTYRSLILFYNKKDINQEMVRMPLINFDVQNYCIAPEQLLGAIEQVISEKDVELAITVTSSSEQRQRILPTSYLAPNVKTRIKPIRDGKTITKR